MSKQSLRLSLEDDVINGFSYSFTKALLEKIKELVEQKRIFDKRNNLLPITETVLGYLAIQVRDCPPNTPEGIAELIATTEEFLAIFVKTA